MYSSQDISNTTEAVDVTALTAPTQKKEDIVAKFKLAWPTAKMFLENAKWITGTAGDRIIDEIIVAGEAINGNAQGEELKAAIKKIVQIWHGVRFPLDMLAKILPFKVGKVVRAFVTIVDELSDQYPEIPAPGTTGA